LARTGAAGKGLLYVIVGFFALKVAAGAGGKLTGTQGALLTVLQQPFGRVLLLIIVIGLFGHGVWRVLQGVLDADRRGGSWGAIGLRVSYVARGLLHGALGIQALRLYSGLSASSGLSERKVAAEALRWPFGDWLLVLVGLGFIGFAIQQVFAAVTCRLEPNLDVANLRRDAGEWAVTISRFGIAARAVVFAMFGWFVVSAGWMRDASQVAGTASPMRAVAVQGGMFGLAMTAIGFIGYGFYQAVHARYLRVRSPDPKIFTRSSGFK
jgi:hypothetical protein